MKWAAVIFAAAARYQKQKSRGQAVWPAPGFK
jgi:hypothetical protein